MLYSLIIVYQFCNSVWFFWVEANLCRFCNRLFRSVLPLKIQLLITNLFNSAILVYLSQASTCTYFHSDMSILFIVQWLNVRCSCSFCWYWWNWWPSLWTYGMIFPLSYRKRETMERVWENEENKRELTRTYKIMAKWENMKRQIIVNKSLHIKLKIGKHYFHKKWFFWPPKTI